MEKYGVDVMLVIGSTKFSSLYYLTRGANLGYAVFIKKLREKPILVHFDMERDNVAHLTDFETIPYSEMGLRELAKIKDPVESGVKRYSIFFEKFNIRGNIYMLADHFDNNMVLILDELRKKYPDLNFVKIQKNLVTEVRRHKTKEEIDRIKEVGKKTQEALTELLEYMKTLKRDDGILKKNGEPFTIGMAKSFLRMELIKRNLLDAAGMIIAQGRDAGVPHNSGNDNEPVRTNTTIVFDIYPQEYGGGYFFDMTRTYSFGDPGKEVVQCYEDLREIQEEALDAAKVGTEAKKIEEMVVDYFESKGYTTLRKDEKAQEGYIHSLGHGVGIAVHEAPRLSLYSDDVLEKGDVFTIEPGLYYPSKGFGMRIEDTVYIDENGKTHNLTHMSKELIIE
ncbi:MAG TPA: aminopeptidase P family protein [candidate division WOR-3 bacterium]|uniref:Aminopeptidase P family protein n=1 Tax=candidate division WOR-3 bacterium TaxID=2052148 RepID=A0A7V5HMG4_UNCW3|nr:aminopeptidase P family protein [candidate division WOR-3 bacterium]